MPTVPASRCVLIVDDDEDSRELLQELLKMSGHHAVAAGSAAAALQCAVEVRPDLALIDLSLPDGDGRDVARRLRAQLGDSIRLVALTGYSDPSTRQSALDAGFDRFVVKPLMGGTLNTLLAE